MTRAVKKAATKPAVKAVKVGDRVRIDGPNGIAVLPDGSAVTCRVVYTIQHRGLHVIDGVSYDAS